MTINEEHDPHQMMKTVRFSVSEAEWAQWGRMASQWVVEQVSEIIADQWLKENTQEVLKRIDPQAVANLAFVQAAAALKSTHLLPKLDVEQEIAEGLRSLRGPGAGQRRT